MQPSPSSVASASTTATTTTTPALPATPRTRALGDNPALASRAAELLQACRAFVQLDAAEAHCVVAYMREVVYARGEQLFRAGDQHSLGHLLLVLDGEVAVDTGSPTADGEVPISVLGAGAILGEMSLLDGAPRSATCTAASPVLAAGLARRGLERLIDEHPRVAAKLLVVLAQCMAERLRALDDQLQMYGQIHSVMRPDGGRARG